MSNQLKADIALLFVTVGWGASFILTKEALAQVETFNFLTIRFAIAFVISSLIFFKKIMRTNKKTLKYSILLGVVLYAHYAFQTVGLNYTSASKSAFITGFNVVMVPILSALLNKTIPEKKVIVSALLALTGLGLLTLKQNITKVNIGDVYTLVCAIIFTFYIILVGKYTLKVDSISLAVMQLGVVGLLNFVTTITVETPIIPKDSGVWFDILVLSLVCTSGAYIIQSVAQRYTSSSHAALIYTGEPVFAAIFGYVLFNETLGMKGTIGALMIMTSMIMVEVDLQKLFKIKRRRVGSPLQK
ncbi:MAG: hypothetical protein PWQ82_1855 [Thermosediminibacterales bacterium]|nr:hypothetical protein [Thermosediminibacterales bacterium]